MWSEWGRCSSEFPSIRFGPTSGREKLVFSSAVTGSIGGETSGRYGDIGHQGRVGGHPRDLCHTRGGRGDGGGRVGLGAGKISRQARTKFVLVRLRVRIHFPGRRSRRRLRAPDQVFRGFHGPGAGSHLAAKLQGESLLSERSFRCIGSSA